MRKDEWGMIVNAPEPSAASRPAQVLPSEWGSNADDSRAGDLRFVLLPNEIPLWHGAPRRGAGWRCLLRDIDSYAKLASLIIPAGFVLFWMGMKAIIPLIALAILVGGAGLALLGRQLGRMRYYVTDRRAIAVGGLLNPWRILSIKHAATQPRRRETRCGTTISLGPGVVGNYGAERWESRNRLTRLFSAPSDDSPMVVFWALEPAEAPFDLLYRLSRQTASAAYPDAPLAGGAQ